MRSKRILNRSQQVMPAIQAAFACAWALVEATKRGIARDGVVGAVGEALSSAGGEIFVILGRNLQRQLRRLLAADDRYQALRARQRRRRSRRDEIVKRAHAGLVNNRKYLKGLFGYEGACEFLGLRGPTAREPRDLHLQLEEAVWWARGWDEQPEPLVAGGAEEAEKCLVRLEDLYAELDGALEEIGRGDREMEAAMLAQRAAMAEFDRAFQHSAGAMEAQLIEAGLPALAAAVRPGVGRRGRPLKNRPVDRYPDLVARVVAEGLMEFDVAEEEGVRDGSAGDESVSTGAGKGLARKRIIEHALPEHSAGERKIEQPVPERSEGEEKSGHLLPECSGSEEKSAHLLHELAGGEEKIEQPLPESATRMVGGFFAGLTLSPPVAACGRARRGNDLGRRSYRVERRGRPQAGRSRLERVRKVTSSWWQRLVRAA